ncbi:MAG: PqqD family protein [Lentisphaerae bacterium]|nr:PqqD family protein [Lentisphaerota bacterium]
MSFFWRREKGNIDRRESLNGVPILNDAVELRPDGAGKMMLRVTFPPQATWMDRFRPRVDTRRYELDDFGGFVVKQMNGTRTVLEIINRFQKEFGMSRRESELGVVAFIKMLMKRRLLSVVINKSVTAEDAARHHGNA